MVTEVWKRVKNWDIERGAYYAILVSLIVVALIGVFRLFILTEQKGDKEMWVERGAFSVDFLEAHEASYAALMGGSVYYPIVCTKLPKREHWAYLFFETREQAEGFGLTSAKGC